MQDHGVKPVANENSIDEKDRVNARSLLPLVALGGGLAAAPVNALELGELTVHSSLGQPLRASIAYALAPSETLSESCVTINASRSATGLPGIGGNTVTITSRAIVITGTRAVREPMLGTAVTINCPYTANLSREYMLFLDPGAISEARSEKTIPTPVQPAMPRTATSAASAKPATASDVPIGQATRYRVQPGDTLYDIARRIENRSIALSPAVNRIHAMNPDAFINGDVNLLKAGSWLAIPSFDGATAIIGPTADTADVPAGTRTGIEPIDTFVPAAHVETATVYDPVSLGKSAFTPLEEPAIADSTADLKPGDVILDGMILDAAERVVIPDTELEGPQTASTSPNVPTAIIDTGTPTESTSLLTWLIGSGLALTAALLLFGRRLRALFGSKLVGPNATRSAVREHLRTEKAGDASDGHAIDDESPPAENIALDARLQQDVDIDLVQDFDFAATAELDFELPFEPETPLHDDDADILPPRLANTASILDSEVLREEEKDEEQEDYYEMSVITDATRMPLPEDATERDLKAVAVESGNAGENSESVTIIQEADYEILEQDYEDELSATQVLHLEIERAAAELASGLNDSGDGSVTPATTEGRDDTTAVTINMSLEDGTADLAVANDDEHVSLNVGNRKLDAGTK
jgi:hypothetical protein